MLNDNILTFSWNSRLRPVKKSAAFMTVGRSALGAVVYLIVSKF